jgi:hypothetical protein
MGSELTRRRVVQAGAAGAATLWLGTLDRLGGTARAGGVPTSGLRRSTYLNLPTSNFTASADGSSHQIELVSVDDLPVAASVPSLRNSDDAFSLRFRGDARDAFDDGIWQLNHPNLGRTALFIEPIEKRSDSQDYEVIVDRTVRIPGINDEGAPDPVNPGARASTTARPSLGDGRLAPRLRRVALSRSTSGRKLLAEVSLANAAGVRTLQATLLRRGKAVATASASPRRGKALLRFGAKAPLRGASYELLLVAIDADGKATQMRKAARLT